MARTGLWPVGGLQEWLLVIVVPGTFLFAVVAVDVPKHLVAGNIWLEARNSHEDYFMDVTAEDNSGVEQVSMERLCPHSFDWGILWPTVDGFNKRKPFVLIVRLVTINPILPREVKLKFTELLNEDHAAPSAYSVVNGYSMLADEIGVAYVKLDEHRKKILKHIEFQDALVPGGKHTGTYMCIWYEKFRPELKHYRIPSNSSRGTLPLCTTSPYMEYHSSSKVEIKPVVSVHQQPVIISFWIWRPERMEVTIRVVDVDGHQVGRKRFRADRVSDSKGMIELGADWKEYLSWPHELTLVIHIGKEIVFAMEPMGRNTLSSHKELKPSSNFILGEDEKVYRKLSDEPDNFGDGDPRPLKEGYDLLCYTEFANTEGILHPRLCNTFFPHRLSDVRKPSLALPSGLTA